MSRIKSVVKNTIWELCYYIIVLALGFVAPRLIILSYGSEVNGLSSTITQILNIILILQAGATTAAIYSLYRPISENDHEGICRNTAYSENFFKKIAWIFGCAMLITAMTTPFLLHTSLKKIQVCIAFVIMGLKSFVDLFFTAKFRIVFTAYQEKYYISIATMVEQVIYYIMVFVTIFLKWNFLFLYVWFLLGCIVKIIILQVCFKRKHADIVTEQFTAERGTITGKNYALANEVSHSVVSSSITVIMSLMYGLKEASVYSVYALVGQALSLISTSLYSSFAPSFGNLVAQGDKSKAASVFSVFQYFFVMMNTILMMCMYFLIVPFIKLYTDGAADINYINWELAIVLVLSGLFSAYRIPYNVIVSTCGYFKETWKQPVLCAFLSVGISVLAGRINYTFIILGQMFFFLANFLYQHFKLKRIVPWLISSRVYIMFIISLIGIAIVGCTQNLIIVPNGITYWIIYAAGFSLFAIAYTLIVSILFMREEFGNSIHYIRRIIQR